MLHPIRLAAAAVLLCASTLCVSMDAQAAAGGPRCKAGFADGTRVQTEARGDLTIGEVRVSDRVWSFNEAVGKPGWSRILQRIDAGPHYKLMSDFSEPGSSTIVKACWIIKRAS